jgi:hypothetical protein
MTDGSKIKNLDFKFNYLVVIQNPKKGFSIRQYPSFIIPPYLRYIFETSEISNLSVSVIHHNVYVVSKL